MCSILPTTSQASVVMTGTRIIYPSEEKSVNISFTSTDNVPSIMELWVKKTFSDDSNVSDAPFIVTPPIFRINPSKGQSVKLIYTGSGLPQDRESVFYLTFLQLPAADKNSNKLLISYKSTVKVFYRPSEINENIDDLGRYLKFDASKSASGIIDIYNNSAFYVTPAKLTLLGGNENEITIKNSVLSMVPPFSHQQIHVRSFNDHGLPLNIGVINDLGGVSYYKINSI